LFKTLYNNQLNQSIIKDLILTLWKNKLEDRPN